MTADQIADDIVQAAKEWVGTTGASRLSAALADTTPPVWVVIASFPGDEARVAAGLDEGGALLTLCSELGTDGICMGCERSTIFEPNPEMVVTYDLERFCITTYDVESKAFLRSCDCTH